VRDVAEDMCIELTDDQLYNCLGIIESMKRSKGLCIVGNICSGKSTLIKIVTLALKKSFDIVWRTSYISPTTFTQQDLYGPALAYDGNSVYGDDHPLQQ